MFSKKRAKTTKSNMQKRVKFAIINLQKRAILSIISTMKRKIYEKLLLWKKQSGGKTALLIDGARRIGKTYIVEEFAKKEYKTYIKMDFSMIEKNILNIFEDRNNNLIDFFNKLQVLMNVKLYERESLIIFDEVQLYPVARQMIKQLVADGRYDYIETGSLISIKKNVKDILIPSEEEHIKMYPMDFEEFLLALGDDMTYNYIKECFNGKKEVGVSIHRKILNLFRQYMLIGGMPMSVEKYRTEKNFELSENEKRKILELYRTDIDKYEEIDATKIRAYFDLIPNQLQRKNKHFKYTEISINTRKRSYYDVLRFLDDSMMVNLCRNITDPSIALELSIDNKYEKCYMGDTGLLVTETLSGSPYVNNDIYKKLLFDKLYVNEGMYAENIVAQMIKSTGHKLYYYKKSDIKNKNNNMEIDFIINGNDGLSAIEVKSSIYKKHTSLDKLRKKFGKKIKNYIVLYDKDVRNIDGVMHYPLYMAEFIK